MNPSNEQMDENYINQFDEKDEDNRKENAEKILQDKNININGQVSTQARTGINGKEEDQKEDKKEKDKEKANLIKYKEDKPETPFDQNFKNEVDNYFSQEGNFQRFLKEQEDEQMNQIEQDQVNLENQVNQNINENNIENDDENVIMEDNLNQIHNEEINNEVNGQIAEDIQPQLHYQDHLENEITDIEEEDIFGDPQIFTDNNNNINSELLFNNENMADYLNFNNPNEENDDDILHTDLIKVESNI